MGRRAGANRRRAPESDRRLTPRFSPRQLERLTRHVPLAGRTARAIAVYAESATAETIATPAQEQGYEGVACVDDAARAVVLYCALWRRDHLAAFRTAALQLAEFVWYMQDGTGRFANFILDWSGTRNTIGPTSTSGGPAWQARGVHALACIVATFGGETWNARFQRSVHWLDASHPYMDIRAVGVLAAVEHWQATADATSAARAIAWSRELVCARDDDRLLNAHGVCDIHLWGHLQECALASAGAALGKAEFVEVARRSADTVLMPAIEWCLTAAHVVPFDMSCTARGLSAVGRATGEPRYELAAQQARAWFSGRNAASLPVYDPIQGMAYDGVDEHTVSRNSGAESNIECGLALSACDS